MPNFLRVSFERPFHQSLIYDSNSPQTFKEMVKKIKQMDPQTPCTNVHLVHELTKVHRHPDGYFYPFSERRSLTRSQAFPEELLKLIECSRPNFLFHISPDPDKVEKCWKSVCPDSQ